MLMAYRAYPLPKSLEIWQNLGKEVTCMDDPNDNDKDEESGDEEDSKDEEDSEDSDDSDEKE